MSRRELPGLIQHNVRLPKPLLDDLETWTNELNAAAQYEEYSRADLVRKILRDAVATWKAGKVRR